MEAPIQGLASYGIAGVVTGLLVWILLGVMRRGEESVSARILWLEAEVVRQRAEFLAALTAQAAGAERLVARIEAALLRLSDNLDARLDRSGFPPTKGAKS